MLYSRESPLQKMTHYLKLTPIVEFVRHDAEIAFGVSYYTELPDGSLKEKEETLELTAIQATAAIALFIEPDIEFEGLNLYEIVDKSLDSLPQNLRIIP